MKLDEIVAWYQKKIGTYDKQQWEKTVEQKILDGFSSVTLKNAKLKTELIDVDLVRGSTFPKAKPKQTLLTVIRLAILRYLLLPLYAKWWVRQTSPNVFALIFGLYITQMLNWATYVFNTNRIDAQAYNLTAQQAATSSYGKQQAAASVVADKQPEEHIVSLAELLIPMALSLLISLIHSQIVATNSASNSNKSKRRRFSNTNLNGGKPTRDVRTRRRKKFVRLRPTELSDTALGLPFPTMQVTKPENNQPQPLDHHLTQCNIGASSNRTITALLSTTNSEEVFLTTTAIIPRHRPETLACEASTSKTSLLDLKNDTTDNQLKKRNVNWHSPLQNYATETKEKQQQTTPQTQNTSTQSTSPMSSTPSTDSPSSSSDTTTPTNDLNMSNANVKECQNNVVTEQQQEAAAAQPANSNLHPLYSTRRNIGEDDGFESLNGKSSSGEDTHSPQPSSGNNIAAGSSNSATVAVGGNTENGCTNQLRLRLNVNANVEKKLQTRVSSKTTSSDDTDEEGGDDCDIISSPASACHNECTTSATEWLGITTNSEDCSYSSELEQSDGFGKHPITDDDTGEVDFTPTTILNPHSSTDRISCTVWEQHEIKKAQMSVLEISSCIIERVESMPETNDYIYIGLGFSFLLSLIPIICRLCEVTIDADKSNDINYFDLPMLLWEKSSFSFFRIFLFAFGNTKWERTVLIIAFVQRLCLTLLLFIIFAVAERTFKQRFLYAKLFSHLTSSRRARKSNLPHFRLNKVRNIKTWLSVRSYLKKRGPQRSVDIIVSAAFMITLLLVAFLSVEWLKDSVHLHTHLNLEALMWSIAIGIFLLRFMTLGNKIHHKYRSVSVLITEQINLYLQIEQKPKKKDELMVSNSVLKLAADLLKELETPFKISGLSANPYLFTTIKVVILSALSGVLSEVLGFKLKLHKIKIK